MYDILDLDTLQREAEDRKRNAQLIRWGSAALLGLPALGCITVITLAFLASSTDAWGRLFLVAVFWAVWAAFLGWSAFSKLISALVNKIIMLQQLKTEPWLEVPKRSFWEARILFGAVAQLVWDIVKNVGFVFILAQFDGLFLVGFGLFWLIIDIALQKKWLYGWIRNPMLAAEYKTALWRVKWVRRVFWYDPILIYLHANILVRMGQSNAGFVLYEQSLKQGIKDLNSAAIIGGLNDTAYYKLLLGQEADILHRLEAALRLDPSNSAVYDTLAEYYILRHHMPARGVRLSERSIEMTTKELQHTAVHAVKLAVYARGLVQLRRYEEAEHQLQWFFWIVKQKNLTVDVAEAYRQAGHVYLHMAKPKAALHCFHLAYKRDPNGIFGRLAWRDAKRLRSLNQSAPLDGA